MKEQQFMKHKKHVIALGFFDGVHIGHGTLLQKAIERANELNVTPAVVSFDVPPAKTINDSVIKLINSPLDRGDIIRRLYGISDLFFLHFDDNLRQMDWERFVEWLKADFGAVHLIAGYDFHFGYKGTGNAEKLQQKCAEIGLGCDIIGEVKYNGGTVSSTRIRELLLSGDIELANKLLGHRHFLNDTVKYGYKVGRTFGTPTINMAFEEGVIVPRYGVYASEAHILDNGQCYEAVTNIGVKPTVTGDNAVTVESYLLGYKGDLYGRRIRVEFYKFMRPETKFDSIDTLRDRIRRDALDTHEYLSTLPDSRFYGRMFTPDWE